MRFLVINVLNDCFICMWLIVCMYTRISGRNSFKGGGGGGENCETRISVLFFFKNERIGNSCRDGTNKTLDISLDLR